MIINSANRLCSSLTNTVLKQAPLQRFSSYICHVVILESKNRCQKDPCRCETSANSIGQDPFLCQQITALKVDSLLSQDTASHRLFILDDMKDCPKKSCHCKTSANSIGQDPFLCQQIRKVNPLYQNLHFAIHKSFGPKA